MGDLEKLDTTRERDGKGRLLPGQASLNPKGRPKGKTIKEMVREWLDTHPEDLKGFVKHFAKSDRALAWKMLEGMPQQKTDITSGGKPIPIFGNVQSNNGYEEGDGDDEADQGDTRGNVSE